MSELAREFQSPSIVLPIVWTRERERGQSNFHENL